jgi:hypothetical protein
MSDQNLVGTTPPKADPSVASNAPPCQFAIACAGHEVVLPIGKLILGRGSRCHIVVDDLLASREHARLTVTEDSVVVEDLGSTNGVYVNERRIQSATPLVSGDRLVVGTQELEIVRKGGRLVDAVLDLGALATVVPRGVDSPLMEIDEPGVDISPKEERLLPTQKADAVATLGRLADRMLTMGRFDAAERLLRTQLHEVLQGARCGRTLVPEVFESVVEYALRLAEVTHKGSWVDYVVEVHMLGSRVMEGPVIARLSALLPLVGDVDREIFFFYQESMRSRREDMSLADRVSCDRILKLELPT